MVNKGIYTSDRDDWETPEELFHELDAEFHFTLDVAANDKNAKCEEYFTPERNGLLQSWKTSGSVWCNPPYGKDIWKWCKKAFEEAQNGQTVVMLIHARTDTKWFHDWVYGKAEIRFLRGRLKFIKDGNVVWNAPFPSLIVIYSRR